MDKDWHGTEGAIREHVGSSSEGGAGEEAGWFGQGPSGIWFKPSFASDEPHVFGEPLTLRLSSPVCNEEKPFAAAAKIKRGDGPIAHGTEQALEYYVPFKNFLMNFMPLDSPQKRGCQRDLWFIN